MLWLQGLHSVWQCARKGGRKRKVKIRWVNDVKMTQYWNGLLSRASFTRTGHDLETIPVMRRPLKLISPPITKESKMKPNIWHFSLQRRVLGPGPSVEVSCAHIKSKFPCERSQHRYVQEKPTMKYQFIPLPLMPLVNGLEQEIYSSHMFAMLYLTL